MWYLLADQMKDGGRGLIEGSNWSSYVISTSVTLASGPSLPGGSQSGWGVGTSQALGVWSGCLCLSSQPCKSSLVTDDSESWWLMRSLRRKARITPLANTPPAKVQKRRWMRLLLTTVKSFTYSRCCQFPDYICTHRCRLSARIPFLSICGHSSEQ